MSNYRRQLAAALITILAAAGILAATIPAEAANGVQPAGRYANGV